MIRYTYGMNTSLNAFVFGDYIYYESEGNIVKLNMDEIDTGTPEIVYDFKQNYPNYAITEFAIKDCNAVIIGYNQNMSPNSVREIVPMCESILGDANGDGNVDIKDSAIIKRYLAGWDVEINMTAADMDGDGKVTIKDSALIKRQLAGWEY